MSWDEELIIGIGHYLVYLVLFVRHMRVNVLDLVLNGV